MIHEQPSKFAGKTVRVTDNISLHRAENPFVVEDWWDRVNGKSWKVTEGNFTVLKYGLRCTIDGAPYDDEVLYGKIGGLGVLVHITEIEEEV